MKQAWYFTRWMFAKCGWPEVIGAVFIGSLIPSIFISDPAITRVFQFITLSSLLVIFCALLYSSIRFMWRQYKAEQEKMFDVLKKEDQ